MWKRDQAVKPTNAPPVPQGVPIEQPTPTLTAALQPEPRLIQRDVMNIGKSVVIKGELNASEDLTIEGQVEGTINLRDNVLTIGANGKIRAQVSAKSVVVLGSVTGNITASERIDIRDAGSVEGDLVAPRVGISEGAHFRGSVDMHRKGGQTLPQGSTAAAAKPAQAPHLVTKQQTTPLAAAAGR